MDEDLAAFPFDERSKAFSHTPANIAKNLQTIGPRDEKCQTVVAQNADCFGKALKGLQIKAGEVKTLELFFRKHAKLAFSSQPSALSQNDLLQEGPDKRARVKNASQFPSVLCVPWGSGATWLLADR